MNSCNLHRRFPLSAGAPQKAVSSGWDRGQYRRLSGWAVLRQSLGVSNTGKSSAFLAAVPVVILSIAKEPLFRPIACTSHLSRPEMVV